MIWLNKLRPSLNYTYDIANISRDDKRNSVRFLNFLEVNVMINSNSETFTGYTSVNIHDYFPYESVHPVSQKNVPYNLDKETIASAS